MTRQNRNKIKAALFLTVFSLSTFISFACSISIDRYYNTGHHDRKIGKATGHTHKSKRHLHLRRTAKDHQSRVNYGEESNCCSADITTFNKVDKIRPLVIGFDNVFFIAFASSFFNVDVSTLSPSILSVKYFSRSYHPPIKNIRIAVQSFRI